LGGTVAGDTDMARAAIRIQRGLNANETMRSLGGTAGGDTDMDTLDVDRRFHGVGALQGRSCEFERKDKGVWPLSMVAFFAAHYIRQVAAFIYM
jgi:hypothetical protein